MKKNITAILCLLLLFSVSISGQKPKKPVVKKPVFTVKTQDEPVVSGDRFFFVLALDKNGNASTSLQTENGSVLTPAQSAKFFKNLSRLGETRLAPAAKEALAPGVIIKPDGSLKYGKLVEAIRAARDPSNLRVMIEADDDFYLGIVKKPDPKKPPRPNPLYMVLTVDDKDLLYMNGEPCGSLQDTSELSNLLKRIFKARADNGVFREGSNAVETTVFLQPRDDLSVADVIKIVKVVRSAGSDTVGLDLDPIEPMIEMRESPRRN